MKIDTSLYDAILQKCEWVRDTIMEPRDLAKLIRKDIVSLEQENAKLKAEREEWRLAALDLRNQREKDCERLQKLENFKVGFWLVLLLLILCFLWAIAH